MSREAVVTGIGVISPAGVGKANFWEGLTSGQSFLDPLRISIQQSLRAKWVESYLILTLLIS